ncbi:uncharacterized protein CLAFUR5_09302 [Fulvia fulva]|uniref:Uncharacterized protein n=1 Tax=Passalora fulva TaxID=5499 RepID=A0A9Q8UTD8_PASFU|nr:uncharacterized protein CLAFUR5_09302 [Fulvia fulva]UJO21687.1 hypothetical protein CLAFUR5_09302 [Fulvia fulva]
MTTIINESTILPNASTTILCDGYPRIEANVTSYTNTYTLTAQASTRTYVPPPCNTGCVTCDIPSKACTKLWSSYNVCTDRSECPYSPACERPTNTKCTATRRPACTFTAGPVRLVYFPVETAGDRLCGNHSALTRPSNTTTPSPVTTIEAYGTTFTSGTAYISFADLAAVDQCGATTGTPMSNFFLPLPSSEVSSMCGGELNAFFQGPTSTQLNFADLIPPIATDIYKCQPQCSWGLPDSWKLACPVIYDDYKPMLAYPTQVAQIQPEWADCGFNPDTYKRYQKEQYYLFDPPIALSQAAEVVKPTAPSPAQTAHKTESAVVQTGKTAPSAEETVASTPVGPIPSDVESDSSDPKEQAPEDEQPDEQVHTAPQEQQSTGDGQEPHQQEGIGQPQASDNEDETPGVEAGPAPEPAPIGPSTALGPPDLSVLDEALSKALEAATVTFDQPQNLESSSGDASIPVPEQDEPPNDAFVPAGLSVLNEALDPARTSGISPASAGAGTVSSVQNDGQAPPGSVIAVLPAAPAVMTVSRSGLDVVVNVQIIESGASATIDGQMLSVNLDGSGVVFDGSSTVVLADGLVTRVTAAAQDPVTVIRIGSAYFADGQILSHGQATNIDGQILSVLPAGAELVVDGTTLLPSSFQTAVTAAPLGSVTVFRSGSEYIVNGQTFTTEGTLDIDGVIATLLLGGDGLVYRTSALSLAPGDATTLATAHGPSEFEIARSGSIVVVDGHTLSAGQATIIGGQSVLNFEGGSGIVIGSRTISLADQATTTVKIDRETTATSLADDGVVTTRPSVTPHTGTTASAIASTSSGDGSRSSRDCGTVILIGMMALIVVSW